jgi:hypothetical protein
MVVAGRDGQEGILRDVLQDLIADESALVPVVRKLAAVLS